MALSATQYCSFYRQFLRHGHRALGLTGLQTKTYTIALRQRFRNRRLRPSTSVVSGQAEEEEEMERLQNTVLFIQNAAAAAAGPVGGAGRQGVQGAFEKKLLKQLVHIEYGVQKSATRTGYSHASALATSASATADGAAQPKSKGTLKKKPDHGSAAMDLYTQVVGELNDSMKMCI